MPAHPHLNAISDDHKRFLQELQQLLDSLSPEQMGWSPDPKSWSIAEVLEHLVVTGELYHPRIQETINRSRELGHPPAAAYKPGLLGRWFISMLKPEPTLKFKAPKSFQPAVKSVAAQTMDRFEASEKAFAVLIEAADAANLNKPRFPSPVTRLLRFSIGEALLLMMRHRQRHFNQIEALMKHPAFPA